MPKQAWKNTDDTFACFHLMKSAKKDRYPLLSEAVVCNPAFYSNCRENGDSVCTPLLAMGNVKRICTER